MSKVKTISKDNDDIQTTYSRSYPNDRLFKATKDLIDCKPNKHSKTGWRNWFLKVYYDLLQEDPKYFKLVIYHAHEARKREPHQQKFEFSARISHEIAELKMKHASQAPKGYRVVE